MKIGIANIHKIDLVIQHSLHVCMRELIINFFGNNINVINLNCMPSPHNIILYCIILYIGGSCNGVDSEAHIEVSIGRQARSKVCNATEKNSRQETRPTYMRASRIVSI